MGAPDAPTSEVTQDTVTNVDLRSNGGSKESPPLSGIGEVYRGPGSTAGLQPLSGLKDAKTPTAWRGGDAPDPGGTTRMGMEFQSAVSSELEQLRRKVEQDLEAAVRSIAHHLGRLDENVRQEAYRDVKQQLEPLDDSGIENKMA